MKIIMIPCKDALEVKLKKIAGSFLFHRILGGDNILGPPPQLKGVEFSKRRGVDAATLQYLKKTYPFGSLSPRFLKERRKMEDIHGN